MAPVIKSRFKNSVIFRALRTLPRSDTRKVVLVCALQVFLGFLDLAGVAAIGVLGALAVTGVQSSQPGGTMSIILQNLGLTGYSIQTQVAILGLVAASLLILRTVASVLITRRVFYFLAHRGATISSNLVSKLLSQDLLEIQSRSSQGTLFALTAGVDALTLGVLGNTIALLSDISLLVILSGGLLLVDPLIAVSSITMFGSLGIFLYSRLNQRAYKLGAENSDLVVNNNKQILEVIESYRESVVRNRRDYYSRQIGTERHKIADTTAELKFMPNIGKYVIESALVVGSIFVSGIQFFTQDAIHAVATLTIFLAAGARIAPAVLRIQNEALSLRASIGGALSTLKIIDLLKDIQPVASSDDQIDTNHPGFVAQIKLSGISLRYPSKSIFALRDINLEIMQGESIAIVGPSGAGKTSLVDVILGILPINSGEILISGTPPLDAISKWPGAIAYVPQNVIVSDTTLKGNIAMGYPDELADIDLIWNALEIAQLSDFVKSLPDGLDTKVGERGSMISGGQRQRLGIARALYTKPKLLILDEATSALDGQSEYDITSAIRQLRGTVTVVMIAHRLSSVRYADKVVYIESGEIKAVGDFDLVRRLVPNFEKQASLMGL